jgi:hypothetical protein
MAAMRRCAGPWQQRFSPLGEFWFECPINLREKIKGLPDSADKTGQES